MSKIISHFQNFLHSKNYSDKTISAYTSCLSEYLNHYKDTNPYKLNQKHLEDFLLNKEFTSVSKQNQFISTLTIFYKNILRSKILKVNLERPRSEKHLPQVIDKNSLIDKLSNIENLKHRSILSLAFSTGMRVSEITNLKIEDIDSKRMLIKIVNGKGRKDRFVPLSETILNLLREYFKQYKPTEYLFNGQSNSKYSISSCEKIYKKYIDEDSSFHCLRHSSFTSLLESGTDIRIIQKLAGHTNIKTTEIYTHVSNDILKKVDTPL